MLEVKRGELTPFDGKSYTAVWVSNLRPGDKTHLGTVVSATYDEGSQGTWLVTDTNPEPMLFLLFAEAIVELPTTEE